MAIKKNPDWHVWVGDVLHWATRPPGIYIVLIAVLGSALLYSFNMHATSTIVTRTVYVPQQTSQPASQAAFSTAPASTIPSTSNAAPVQHSTASIQSRCPYATIWQPPAGRCEQSTFIELDGTEHLSPDCGHSAVWVEDLKSCELIP